MVGKSKVAVDTKSTTNASDEDLKTQLALLKKRLAQLEAEAESNKEDIVLPVVTDEESFREDIKSDEYIKVISLYSHTLTLTTQSRGMGKVFNFRKFGESKRILYHDLVDIMENHQSGDYTNFLAEGYYYIADKRVIRKHGLDDMYAKILTKETIEKILNGTPSESADLFKSANRSQQKIICDMVIEKIANGQDVDLNLVDTLSRISGVEIKAKAEEAKYYTELQKSDK